MIFFKGVFVSSDLRARKAQKNSTIALLIRLARARHAFQRILELTFIAGEFETCPEFRDLFTHIREFEKWATP